MFVHGFGKLWRKYSQISQQTERVAFLTEKFGRKGVDVLQELLLR
jgi:hypothetical protein